MPIKLELKGKRYGKLLVLEEIGRKNKSPLWKCQCDCGKICEYTTKELQNQNRIMCDKCKGIDISGQRFGKLIALKPTEERKSGAVVWECQCDCGKIHYAPLTRLKEGKVQSCGCSRKEATQKSIIDLTRQRFGKLIVLEKTDKRKDRSVIWKCQCDCGNIVEIDSHSLRRGNTQSCGCLKSKGELKIIQLLQELNIPYEYQKTFDTCRYSQQLFFDFYLPELNLCIEYDGQQHFEPIEGFGGQERYIHQLILDKTKNEWCQNNNIFLKRIPYIDYDKINKQYIDDIIEDIKKYKGENK